MCLGFILTLHEAQSRWLHLFLEHDQRIRVGGNQGGWCVRGTAVLHVRTPCLRIVTMPLSLDPVVCLAVACEPMGRLASESFDIPVPRAKRLLCDCVEQQAGDERLDLCIYPWWNSRCQPAIFVFHGGSLGSGRHLDQLSWSRLVLYN